MSAKYFLTSHKSLIILTYFAFFSFCLVLSWGTRASFELDNRKKRPWLHWTSSKMTLWGGEMTEKNPNSLRLNWQRSSLSNELSGPFYALVMMQITLESVERRLIRERNSSDILALRTDSEKDCKRMIEITSLLSAMKISKQCWNKTNEAYNMLRK